MPSAAPLGSSGDIGPAWPAHDRAGRAALREESGIPELSEADFERFRALLGRACGLNVPPTKKALLRGRIGRRLRALKVQSFRAYYDQVTGGGGAAEMKRLWSAVTTHETRFFRERHHFDALQGHVLPELMARRPAGRPLRMWSACCATGQETYSMASVALVAAGSTRPVHVVGTDIDRQGIEIAKRGLYPRGARREIPPLHLFRHFEIEGTTLSAGEALRRVVTFRPHNLRDLVSPGVSFDVIFCRNAMMYFQLPFRAELLALFRRALAPDGVLFVGSAEGLHGLPALFRPERVGAAIAYRPAQGGAP